MTTRPWEPEIHRPLLPAAPVDEPKVRAGFWTDVLIGFIATSAILLLLAGIVSALDMPDYVPLSTNEMKRIFRVPQTKFQLLPPAEFDVPYTGWGELIVRRGTESQVREWCGNVFRSTHSALGCAMPPRTDGRGGDCIIYITEDRWLVLYQRTYDMIFRHERAHCNGWHHEPSE
jgi:hypothetical protein